MDATSNASTCFVAVHVGAGFHSSQKSRLYKSAMRQACVSTMEELKHGGSANDAVACAIRILEDSPVTNAGIGSNLNRLGLVECDAAIMSSNPDAFGAVGAVSETQNPIDAANALMKNHSRGPDEVGLVPPMFLVGLGADQWARDQGVPMCKTPREKITEEALAKYESYMKRKSNSEDMLEGQDVLMDTVGAVCVDIDGNISAGVSSGGIALKLPGRVGEAAMFGCGCWAERRNKDNDGSTHTPSLVGCSVTGTGEQIMRTMLARDCAQRDGDIFTVLEECLTGFSRSPALKAYDHKCAGLVLVRRDSQTGQAGKYGMSLLRI